MEAIVPVGAEPCRRSSNGFLAELALKQYPPSKLCLPDHVRRGVAQTVGDAARTVQHNRADDMGVMADKQRRTGLNDLPGKSNLRHRRICREFLAPVQRDDHIICVAPEPLHVAQYL